MVSDRVHFVSSCPNSVSIEGESVRPWPTTGGCRVVCTGVDKAGVAINVTTRDANLEVVIADHSPGHPAAVSLPAQRPVTTVASQDGDVTVVSKAAEL